jgi:hypothetical protein
MREFVTAEIMCRDRFGNEISVFEISVEKDFGSLNLPDFHVQKDRYETARKSRVSLLDGATFQLVDSGEIVRRAASKRDSLFYPSRAA